MRESLHKIVYLAVGVIFALMITAVFSPRPEMTHEQASGGVDTARRSPADGDIQAVMASLGPSSDLSAILLPLGPADGRLPGLPQIWDGFLQSGDVDYPTVDDGAFEGLQAVENVSAFSENSVAELFLSGYPDQVFIHAGKLLVLNTHNKVQIIDCMRPGEPKLSGFLPYDNVLHMEMRGGIAYLLASQPNAPHDTMIVADLDNPLEPLELARISLPKHVETFFFADRQLVVYVNSLEQPGAHLIYLYDLVDDDRLVLVDSAASPLLRDNFLKFGNYLLVPGTRSGAYVYDFSDPLQPGEVAMLDVRDKLRVLVRHGDKVFALGGLNRVYVFDLQVPGKPVFSAVVQKAKYPAFFISYNNYTYYFTLQGYLQVYASTPYELPVTRNAPIGGSSSDLVMLHGKNAFTLLGEKPDVFPQGVDSVRTLPADCKILDTASWQGGVAILQEDGLVRFLGNNEDALPGTRDSIKLPPGQRWLTAGSDHLYVGGKMTISVITRGDKQQLSLAGQVNLPGKESWDGLVLQQTLCVAAGKDGLMTFSLRAPDKPSAANSWIAPQYLQSQVDIRRLAAPGGNRLIAGAGRMGMLDGRLNTEGQFELQGFLTFQTPVSTLAMLNQLCLVATAEDVQVVDLRNDGALQNLGKISFFGVTRLAVAAPGYWAGFVPGAGWSVFRAPHILTRDDVRLLKRAKHMERVTDQQLFRLNLFNDNEVKTVPGLLRFSALAASQGT